MPGRGAAPLGAALLLAVVAEGLGAVPRGALLQQLGAPSDSESMAYLLRTLGKFKSFAESSEAGLESRHEAEKVRLQQAIQRSEDEGVKLALGQSITSSQESLLETQRIYSSMARFSESMMNLLRSATSKGYGCEQVACGPHASCTATTAGAECVCHEGYVGLGANCHPPPEFMPHRLLLGSGGHATQAADLHVSIFEANEIAVVFRDVSKGNAGRALVGRVREAGMADLSPPEQFTAAGGRAFDPVVAGTAGRRIAVAWRDESRSGTCWLRAATLGIAGVRGADMALTWAEPVNFCADQAHRMSIMPFARDRLVVLFSDRLKASQHAPAESFGNSLLAKVTDTGRVAILGRFRFTDYPVCRLEATKITPNAFVLAARAGKATDEMDTSVSVKQEAMAMYGEVVDDDLVFDPNPLNIEPNRSQIWARGVSLIAPNTIAYAYQDGQDMNVKMAVVAVDPVTHRMKKMGGPVVVRRGFSPYISMLSVPYTPSDPHTLIYYEGDHSSLVNLCSWAPQNKKLDRCEDFAWLTQKITSVSGVHLGGGKSFMVFVAESGVPYYGVFGLSKK